MGKLKEQYKNSIRGYVSKYLDRAKKDRFFSEDKLMLDTIEYAGVYCPDASVKETICFVKKLIRDKQDRI